jgi:hypothetical protein
MPLLTALLSMLAVYAGLYVFYRWKSGGRMKGLPGILWLFAGSVFISIASAPAVNGGSLEASLVGSGFFLVLFSFLAAQRFHLTLPKPDSESLPRQAEAPHPNRAELQPPDDRPQPPHPPTPAGG